MARFIPGQIVEVRGTVVDCNGVYCKIEFACCHPLSRVWFRNDSPDILRAHEPPLKVGDIVTHSGESVVILAIVENRCWVQSTVSQIEFLTYLEYLKRPS